MNEYHKIHTVFKRPQMKGKHVIVGDWSRPEFQYLQNDLWHFTEKVDGTNIRVFWNGGSVCFGGKTSNASIPAKLVKNLYETFHSSDMMNVFGTTPACLYGEGYGAGIQNGGVYSPDQKFILFDVKINGVWLSRNDVVDVAEKLRIDWVPLVGTGTLHDMISLVGHGLQSVLGDVIAEGIVARPMCDLLDRQGNRIITKLKHRDFPREA